MRLVVDSGLRRATRDTLPKILADVLRVDGFAALAIGLRATGVGGGAGAGGGGGGGGGLGFDPIIS